MGNACMKCITRITVKDASTMTEGVPLLSFDENGSRSELRSRVRTKKIKTLFDVKKIAELSKYRYLPFLSSGSNSSTLFDNTGFRSFTGF